MLSCKDTTQLISRSLDDRLSLAERLAVRIHLAVCDACTRYRKQLLFLRDVIRHGLRAYEDAESAPVLAIGLPDHVRARIKVLLSQSRPE